MLYFDQKDKKNKIKSMISKYIVVSNVCSENMG